MSRKVKNNLWAVFLIGVAYILVGGSIEPGWAVIDFCVFSLVALILIFGRKGA